MAAWAAMTFFVGVPPLGGAWAAWERRPSRRSPAKAGTPTGNGLFRRPQEHDRPPRSQEPGRSFENSDLGRQIRPHLVVIGLGCHEKRAPRIVRKERSRRRRVFELLD